MEYNENTLNNKTAGGVLTSACGLWVHIASLSLVIMLLSIYITLQNSNALFVFLILFSFILCQFFCFRLNLDEKLFNVLYENIEDITSFDKTLELLFNKNNQNRTIEERILGTKKIFISCILTLLLQTILSFCSIYLIF